MKMVLKVLSPLRVGGRLLTRVDYVWTPHRVYIVDFEALGVELHSRGLLRDMVDWIAEGREEGVSISDYLARRRLLNDRRLIEKVSVRNVPVQASAPREPQSILEQAVDPVEKTPVIPGSSIKGAIRNALFSNRFSGVSGRDDMVESALKRRLASGRGRSNSPAPMLDYDPFRGTLRGRSITGPNADWLRCLRVSDAFPRRAASAVLEAKVFSISGSGAEAHAIPKRYPMWVECVLPGSEFELDVTWDAETAERCFSGSSPFDGVGRLLDECSAHTRRVCAEEKAFIEGFGLGELSQHLSEMESTANLRLGWGCGWLSTSLGSTISAAARVEVRRALYRPREGFPFPKHRRYQVETSGAYVRPRASFGWVRVVQSQTNGGGKV